MLLQLGIRRREDRYHELLEFSDFRNLLQGIRLPEKLKVRRQDRVTGFPMSFEHISVNNVCINQAVHPNSFLVRATNFFNVSEPEIRIQLGVFSIDKSEEKIKDGFPEHLLWKNYGEDEVVETLCDLEKEVNRVDRILLKEGASNKGSSEGIIIF